MSLEETSSRISSLLVEVESWKANEPGRRHWHSAAAADFPTAVIAALVARWNCGPESKEYARALDEMERLRPPAKAATKVRRTAA